MCTRYLALRTVSGRVAVRDATGNVGVSIEGLCVVTRGLPAGCAFRLVLLSVADIRVDNLGLFPLQLFFLLVSSNVDKPWLGVEELVVEERDLVLCFALGAPITKGGLTPTWREPRSPHLALSCGLPQTC